MWSDRGVGNLTFAVTESLVIFADIDGVFHDADTDPFCWAPLLWEVIAPYDVSIVIHSSWRNASTLDAIRSQFPRDMQERIIAVTEGIEPYDSILQHGPRSACCRCVRSDPRLFRSLSQLLRSGR